MTEKCLDQENLNNNIIYVDLNRYYTTNPGLILIGGLPAILVTI